MDIYRDIKQGSEEWNQLRIGSIGGPTISDAVAEGSGKTRDTLMNNLIEELWTGVKKELWLPYRVKYLASFEGEARDWYRIETGRDVEEVGLIRKRPHRHYSPDGLPNGRLLEIKCVEFSTFREFDAKRNVVTGYRKQMQWGMDHADVDVCDYLVYCPFIEPPKQRGIITEIKRDEKEIVTLSVGADKFIAEMFKLKTYFENRKG